MTFERACLSGLLLFGLTVAPGARAGRDCTVNACVLARLAERPILAAEANWVPILRELLPETYLRIPRGSEASPVTELKFDLHRAYPLGPVRHLRVTGWREYRRVSTLDFRHVDDARLITLDVCALGRAWLVEVRRRGSAGCEQLFLEYSKSGVLEAVSVSPGGCGVTRMPVTYPH